MTHGSLFAGIGGFELAAQWMGWENVFNCEIDPFCQQVLKYYHPDAIQYHNIKTTDFTIHRGGIDILTGGFPCQPASSAGKRKGTSDDRWLWPEMLRAIREIQPGFVVAENVRGLLSLERGLVFDTVLSDLEAEGYEVIPFLLPACALNAPHRRDRIWIVAKSITRRTSSKWKGIVSNINRNHKSSGLLPTPAATNYKGGRRDDNPRRGVNPMTNNLQDAISFLDKTGKTSQLNPRFVAEMMGYPPDYLELPFQNIEKKESKDMATPSSPK